MPSPCGANADCRVVENRAVCSCVTGMFGTPPNCRPECLIDQDCPLTLSCLGNKCKDPCVGSCGINARCNVINHRPICSCLSGFEGDPFSGCSVVQGKWNEFNFKILEFLYLPSFSKSFPFFNFSLLSLSIYFFFFCKLLFYFYSSI